MLGSRLGKIRKKGVVKELLILAVIGVGMCARADDRPNNKMAELSGEQSHNWRVPGGPVWSYRWVESKFSTEKAGYDTTI